MGGNAQNIILFLRNNATENYPYNTLHSEI